MSPPYPRNHVPGPRGHLEITTAGHFTDITSAGQWLSDADSAACGKTHKRGAGLTGAGSAR
jgi:hypothetical protein